MVYNILDQAKVGEDQFDYFIPLATRRFIYLHPTSDLHGVVDIRGRPYMDGMGIYRKIEERWVCM